MSYIRVTDSDDNFKNDFIELPLEEDGCLLMSTLSSHFPSASGLKFLNHETSSFRGIRLTGGAKEPDARLQPPEKGWEQSQLYFVVNPSNPKNEAKEINGKKRSVDKEDLDVDLKVIKVPRRSSSSSSSSSNSCSNKKCSDLIILGLPWKTTESDLKEYFSQFGSVLMVQVKRHPMSGESKGYGFVRFESFEVQSQVTSSQHRIGGRMCDVKIPFSSQASSKDNYSRNSSKIFVGRLTEEVTTDDLKEFFSEFGAVTDVFIPKPFRGFAFVSFTDSHVVQSLLEEDYILPVASSGSTVSIHVSNAVPKNNNGIRNWLKNMNNINGSVMKTRNESASCGMNSSSFASHFMTRHSHYSPVNVASSTPGYNEMNYPLLPNIIPSMSSPSQWNYSLSTPNVSIQNLNGFGCQLPVFIPSSKMSSSVEIPLEKSSISSTSQQVNQS